MTKITKEEVLNLARMSRLDIHKDEIVPLIQQLEAVLSYAERVKEIATDAEISSNRNINVFREDVVVRSDAAAILLQAPEREGDYFVVPAILEK